MTMRRATLMMSLGHVKCILKCCQWYIFGWNVCIIAILDLLGMMKYDDRDEIQAETTRWAHLVLVVNPIVDIPSNRGDSESHKTTPTLV